MKATDLANDLANLIKSIKKEEYIKNMNRFKENINILFDEFAPFEPKREDVNQFIDRIIAATKELWENENKIKDNKNSI